jgi:hypothetical protein
LTDANGARAELIMRAQEDGAAFRYHMLGEGVSQVTSESTGFMIPSGARVLSRAYDGGDIIFVPTAGAYEQPPRTLALGEGIDATGFAFSSELEAGDDAFLSRADLDQSYCGSRLDEMPEEVSTGFGFRMREGRGIGRFYRSHRCRS